MSACFNRGSGLCDCELRVRGSYSLPFLVCFLFFFFFLEEPEEEPEEDEPPRRPRRSILRILFRGTDCLQSAEYLYAYCCCYYYYYVNLPKLYVDARINLPQPSGGELVTSRCAQDTPYLGYFTKTLTMANLIPCVTTALGCVQYSVQSGCHRVGCAARFTRRHLILYHPSSSCYDCLHEPSCLFTCRPKKGTH